MADTQARNSNIIWLLLLGGGAYLLWNRNKKRGIAVRQMAQKGKAKTSLGGGGGGGGFPSRKADDTILETVISPPIGDINVTVTDQQPDPTPSDIPSIDTDIIEIEPEGGAIAYEPEFQPRTPDDEAPPPDDEAPTPPPDTAPAPDDEAPTPDYEAPAPDDEAPPPDTGGGEPEPEPEPELIRSAPAPAPAPDQTAQAGFVRFVDFDGDEDIFNEDF